MKLNQNFFKKIKGGFGHVYLGLNSDTGELFAVKQLDLDISEDKKSVKKI